MMYTHKKKRPADKVEATLGKGTSRKRAKKQTTVCDRCLEVWSRKSWDHWASSGISSAIFATINVEDLQISNCRICNFLAKVISIHYLAVTVPNMWCRPRSLQRRPGIEVEICDSGRSDDTSQPQLLVSWLDVYTLETRMRDIYPAYVNLDTIRNWVRGCKDHHKHCRQATVSSRLRGLKVIDCTVLQVIPAPSNYDFVALSYVWGTSTTFETLENAPATISDSITVTVKLGYRYLWIDRYCIDQNNDQETHDQILQMSNIYNKAQLTIIAAAGKDPSCGLPGIRPGSRPLKLQSETVNGLRLVLHPPAGTVDVTQSVWHSRAWTFQEGFFATRRLFFTDHQALFVCQESISCEAMDTGSLIRGSLSDCLSPANIANANYSAHRQVMDMVKSYSRRQLTYDKDALNAIQSALSTFTRGDEPIHHLWGVPVEFGKYPSEGNTDFRFALDWYHSKPARRRHSFPSWSPLGWDGAIDWDGIDYTMAEEHCALWKASGCRQINSLKEPRVAPTNIVRTLRSHSETTNKQLQVKAYSCFVDIVSVTTMATKHVDADQIYIALPPKTNRNQLMLKVYWDSLPSCRGKAQQLLCLAVENRGWRHYLTKMSYKRRRRYTTECLLILEPDGRFFRRAGICMSYGDVHSPDVLFRGRTGTIIDSGYDGHYGIKFRDYLEDIWEGVSKQRTIVIW